jgi:hypothetical protein
MVGHLLAWEMHEHDGTWHAWVSWVQQAGGRHVHKVVDVRAGSLQPLEPPDAYSAVPRRVRGSDGLIRPWSGESGLRAGIIERLLGVSLTQDAVLQWSQFLAPLLVRLADLGGGSLAGMGLAHVSVPFVLVLQPVRPSLRPNDFPGSVTTARPPPSPVAWIGGAQRRRLASA